MIRQYFAQRCRGGNNPLRIGVIAAGSIYYLQDPGYFQERYRGRPVCRTPWIVEGFLNGVLHAARRDPETGAWCSIHTIGRSDIAMVRSLRDGQRRQVAVWFLLRHEDLGLWKEPTSSPSLPDLRLYRRSRQGEGKLARSRTGLRASGHIVAPAARLPSGDPSC